MQAASLPLTELYEQLNSSVAGLTSDEAQSRLAEFGFNSLAPSPRLGFLKLIGHAVANPLVLLLLVLAIVSAATGDARAAFTMALMIVLGVSLKLVQEAKADRAAAKLKSLISLTATVVRDGQACEIPVAQLVPGDLVQLSAGDMAPADIRLVVAKDLFIVQATLTGEAFSVEKTERWAGATTVSPIEFTNIAFLGTNVESGTGTGIVVATGADTYLGSLAESLQHQEPPSAFERGVADFTRLMIVVLLVLAPVVFLLNGLLKGNWSQAFFFALAVAVGLTPEMLPMIVTVCLSKGALIMSARKVVVKRLNAIQNLGAMDVLCTDKTGTLTMDRVILERHCDVVLKDDDYVLTLAYLNSHFQTGLRNVLDRAVLAHSDSHAHAVIPDCWKVDEIPFDFQRRVMSVVVRMPAGHDLMITKGAPEAIFPRCSQFQLDGELFPIEPLVIEDLQEEYERLSADGFRVLAIATRKCEPRHESGPQTAYTKSDERELVLHGYVAFLDPPKESARVAIQALGKLGIAIKVVTGDNDLVARKICREVGVATDQVLLGSEIESLTDEELKDKAAHCTLFARVSPVHKQRIVEAIKSRGHVVGFMGDGINDAPALRAADVGVSVDSAVDIAKESADLILLEKSLLVLEAGVVEGRKVFANILKYVRMGASSNFGNMFSVLGASVFVPFLPLAPIQILANNLLYDISQTAIPTDDVDEEQIQKPRPWNMNQLARFIFMVGPCSSLFDYSSFLVLLYLFDCREVGTPETLAKSQSLFQTGWFLESLLTQTLIIHIIRTNRIPFVQSRASWPLLATTSLVAVVGAVIPYSPLGDYLGFTTPPLAFWPWLGVTLVAYAAVTHAVKTWLTRRGWI
jgi:Mg2+-importing ATPase